MKKTFTFITTFVTLLVVALFLVMNSGATVSAQETNLLVNPGFNGPHETFTPIFGYQQNACQAGVCTTAQMPPGWLPWWTPQSSDDDQYTNRMPEYKPVCPYSPCPEKFQNRLQGGGQAAQYFTFWSKHTGGMYQTVTVPNNATLKYSVYGQAWSTSSDSAKSEGPSPMNMKIGIDPTGGTDPWSANIVWGPTADSYDAYRLFEVVATAQGDKVTVFMFSSPSEPRKHNDVYWDEASLVTTDGSEVQTVVDPTTGAVATVAPVNSSVRFAPAGPTPTPNAGGVIEVIVQSGDTLWSIAARAGMDLDDVLALNPGLNRNSLLGWGDRIVLGYADGAQGSGGGGAAEAAPAQEAAEAAPAEEAATSEESAEAALAEDASEEGATEAVAAAEPTAVPQPTATALPEGGAICLLAFDDVNGDGQYGAGESLRSSVAFTIAKDQAVVSNYISDGVNEPFCIEGLEPGNYRISRSFTANEVATNGADWGASIVDGTRQQFDFGSRIDETAMAVADTSAADAADAESSEAMADTSAEMADSTATGAVEEAAADAESGGIMSWLVWIILAIAIILIIGVALVIMSARRATID